MLYSVANLRLSVAVSVTFCIVAKLRVLQQKLLLTSQEVV